MLHEIVALFAGAPEGVLLDCTLGGAGHSVAVLEACPQLSVIGIDRDPDALSAAGARLQVFGSRASTARARFDQLDEVLDERAVETIAGFLFDLGVSSPQLDRADRGFSFRHDGPLDMRMDPDAPRTAADFVNSASHGEIASALKHNADERFAGRIASAIVDKRPFETTTELASVVVDAIPAAARRTGGHPAKRTFQALRIEVNDELDMLTPALEAAIDRLAPGGLGLVLTYHSGEDRIVKRVFRDRSTSDAPVGLPITPAETDFTALRPLAQRPTDAEQETNPRARSARLRGLTRNASTGVAA